MNPSRPDATHRAGGARPRRVLLALNAGSTSLKGGVFVATSIGGRWILHGLGRASVVGDGAGDGGAGGSLQALLAALPAPGDTPEVVVHRMVHGGQRVDGVPIDATVHAELDAAAGFAPMHQRRALDLYEACRRRWPEAVQAAAFDTSFHAHLAPWSRRLPVPAVLDRLGLRRFGYHGLACASALRNVARHDAGVLSSRVVMAHLGGGCSVSAVAQGRSIDTSMSLTPLGGLPGPRRSGDLDPALVIHALAHGPFDGPSLLHALAEQGGMAGIAGLDDVQAILASDAPESRLAVEQFVMRIAQAIAAMATALGGIDHLVFSGGIGHRSAAVRMQVVAHLQWLGLRLDATLNAASSPSVGAGDGPRIWAVEVDEERLLAESCLAWFAGAPAAHASTGAA